MWDRDGMGAVHQNVRLTYWRAPRAGKVETGRWAVGGTINSDRHTQRTRESKK